MSTIQNFFLKPWLYIVIIIVGVALKFYHLDSKLFWMDEVSTVLYTTGIKDANIKESIPVNQIVNYRYYDSLLHLNNKPYTIKSEVSGILSETHLTPAHYVFLTLWYRLVGDDDMDYRLFSVFFFILSLPFVFLLAKTLFKAPLAGWIAVSLFAVSPFIHFEAQEARYYILWVFFFILSNYLFLKAINHKVALWWIGYTIASILALYTSVASAPFIFGHLVYIILFKKEARIHFLLSLLFIVLAYLPWMYFLYTVRDTIEGGLAWHKFLATSLFPFDLLFFQLLGYVRHFVFLFDSDLYHLLFSGDVSKDMYPYLLIDLAVIALIIYSIFYLFSNNTSKQIKSFLMLIILPLFLLLFLSDVFRHTGTSMLWRYQIENVVGFSFVVTNLLKDKVAKGKLLFIGIYMGLILLSIASILKIAANRCWNTSGNCEPNFEEAELISQAAHPLIITDFSSPILANFLAVLNNSKSKNADIIYGKGTLTDLKAKIAGKGYSEIYVIQASDSLTQQLKLQFGESLQPLRKDINFFKPQIWQIKL